VKILQIIPDFVIGGAERMAEALTVSLFDKDHDVEAVSLYNYKSAITKNLEQKGIKVHYLNKKKGMDISMILKLYHLFIRFKPDVIHTHRHVCQYVIPAAVVAGVPVRVHTVHSIAQKESVPKKLQKIFFKYFKLVPVAISEVVKESICEVYGLNDEKVPIAYNGMDLSRYVKKENYDVSDNKFKIIHIGRFSEEKNHFELLKAFSLATKKYPDMILDLYGEGELESQIRECIQELGLNEKVRLCGIVNNINEILHNYDLFVLSSRYEGMPMTIIEAMASGMPIVAANVGGVPDMLENEVSALLCTSDSESVSDCILRMYENRELREKLGSEALNMSDKFSLDNMCAGYIEIYKSGR